ncbi:MAG: hypothetical protein WCI51_20440 [Lentisphaerota bacterium]
MNVDYMTLGVAILALFSTILIASIGGTAAILWRIASVDKSKVDWTACEKLRTNCPCVKDIEEIKKKQDADHDELNKTKVFVK